MTRRARPPREEISAGGVVFRRDANGPRFLLIRDSYKNWGFPKGHIEAAETPDAAAVREVREETGLRALSLRAPIEVVDWHFRFRGRLVHKICHFYLIEAEHGRARPLRREGITACRWLGFDEAMALVSYDNARAVLTRARSLLEDTAR
ncbi:MAG: NUDIX hydrolase [Gemmatimonadetes bacterium]|nr:NUDIX hydrolase [Gemmatimonadota bacterium]